MRLDGKVGAQHTHKDRACIHNGPGMGRSVRDVGQRLKSKDEEGFRGGQGGGGKGGGWLRMDGVSEHKGAGGGREGAARG